MTGRRAFLLTHDFPPLEGGIAGYLFGLWSHLPADRVAVLAPAVPGGDAFDRGHALRVYRRRYLRRLPFPLDRLARAVLPLAYLRTILPRERTEILHCGHVLTSGVAGLVLARRRRLPYAVYAYGADVRDYEQTPGLARLLRRVLTEAEGVVTVSEFTAGLVQQAGVPRDRIVKVLMGIDTRRFHPGLDGRPIRARHGLDGRPVILSVARLVARKGHDMVIRALACVRAAHPGTAYLIVGSGPERAGLARLAAECGVADAVCFAGFVPESELPAYYAACDCFILCSRQIGTNVEGAGNVSLEAAACARPVIAGRSGGTAEHVVHDETGLLVDPEDPAAIADGLLAILGDRGRAGRLGRQGRRMVEERFVWERTAPALAPLL